MAKKIYVIALILGLCLCIYNFISLNVLSPKDTNDIKQINKNATMVTSKYTTYIYSYTTPKVTIDFGDVKTIHSMQFKDLIHKYVNIDVNRTNEDIKIEGFSTELRKFKITLYSTFDKGTFKKYGSDAVSESFIEEKSIKLPGISENTISHVDKLNTSLFNVDYYINVFEPVENLNNYFFVEVEDVYDI